MKKSSRSLSSKFLMNGVLSVCVIACIVFLAFLTFLVLHDRDYLRMAEIEALTASEYYDEGPTGYIGVYSHLKSCDTLLSQIMWPIDILEQEGTSLHKLISKIDSSGVNISKANGHKLGMLASKITPKIRKAIVEKSDKAMFMESVVTKVAGVAVLSTLFLMIFLGKSISNPLVALRKAAIDIGDGKFDVDLKVETGDELGQLANAVNIMADKISTSRQTILKNKDEIKKQYQEMEGLNEELKESLKNISILSKIGNSITSTLDFDEMFKKLSKHMKSIIDESVYALAIYNKATKRLDYKLIIDKGNKRDTFSVDCTDTTRLDVMCMARGAEIFIMDFDDKASYSNYTWMSKDILTISKGPKSIIYVPLMLEDEIVGIACLENERPNWYKQQHLDIIRNLNAYVTVALKNAQTYEQLSKAHTTLKKTHDQLVVSDKMASIGSMVAGISHEINTPVGISMTASSVLIDTSQRMKNHYSSGKVKRSEFEEYLDNTLEAVKIINSNLQRAATLINSFKQVTVDRTSDKKRSFNLQEYINDVVLSLKPKFKRTPFEIVIDVDDSLELEYYPGAIAQVLTNLLLNSLTHGFKDREKGSIEIKAELNDNDILQLKYRDDGVGIPDDQIEKIYDAFYTSDENLGTGMGLNITKNIVVKKLRGTIECSSAEGQGTEFNIKLPL